MYLKTSPRFLKKLIKIMLDYTSDDYSYLKLTKTYGVALTTESQTVSNPLAVNMHTYLTYYTYNYAVTAHKIPFICLYGKTLVD